MQTADQSGRVASSRLPQIWAFAGGKGGVGKSLVCASAAVSLAQQGLRVIALDADLGAANLHTLLGLLHPARTVAEYFESDSLSLADVCLPTRIQNLTLISGASSILESVNHDFEMRRTFLKDLVELDADAILIDLGAGAHYPTLDFFAIAGHRIVVTSPEPTSIQNTYSFLKAATYRRLELAHGSNPEFRTLLRRAVKSGGDNRIESINELLDHASQLSSSLRASLKSRLDSGVPKLIINQSGFEDEKRVYSALAIVCTKYLGFKPSHVGTLPDDPSVRVAVRRMRPVLVDAPDSPFGECLARLVTSIKDAPATPDLDLLLAASQTIGRGTALTELADELEARQSRQTRSNAARPKSLADALRAASNHPPATEQPLSEQKSGAPDVAPAPGALLDPHEVKRPLQTMTAETADLNLDSFDEAIDSPFTDSISDSVLDDVSEIEEDQESRSDADNVVLDSAGLGESEGDSDDFAVSEKSDGFGEDAQSDDADDMPVSAVEPDAADDMPASAVEPDAADDMLVSAVEPDAADDTPAAAVGPDADLGQVTALDGEEAQSDDADDTPAAAAEPDAADDMSAAAGEPDSDLDELTALDGEDAQSDDADDTPAAAVEPDAADDTPATAVEPDAADDMPVSAVEPDAADDTPAAAVGPDADLD
ncbi:MAG: P-loop NTPase, partial [Myxococcota bacterium]|nr:P-loop NTPase [Myxococcota bacterium]